MRRHVIGLLSLCLMVSLTGCANSQTMPSPIMLVPTVPEHLIAPLPAPASVDDIHANRDLLELLADYEALRRRFNADRVGIAEILQHPGGDGAEE
ncbi:hypothetical protein SAMN05661010_02530 [Modicisalibacter muralis]|uniref:Secreted protein n=1 Tax=Modicisalibacter muralis TaxID=119000 RepID=A0A1G9MUR0_9GAMM|nr:hypothetical protein SAMN05661010_02530 [Halomonas muralis]